MTGSNGIELILALRLSQPAIIPPLGRKDLHEVSVDFEVNPVWMSYCQARMLL